MNPVGVRQLQLYSRARPPSRCGRPLCRAASPLQQQGQFQVGLLRCRPRLVWLQQHAD